MSTNLITAPTSEPISLAEAKLYLKVDVIDDDSLITSLITACRQQCEQIMGRSIMPQTWEKVLDDFPEAIELLYPRIISVTSVKYIDPTTGNELVLSPTLWTLDKDSEPGWVLPAYNIVWPVPLYVANSVRVRYVAGYPDAASVPENIKQWIKMAINTLYDNRAGIIIGSTVEQLPRDFMAGLLDYYTIRGM